MRVISVRIFNYRSIKNLELQFNGDGTHALLGSPGAGKSSVLGAIAFALYGDPGPGIDLVEVRYDKAEDKSVAGADVTWQHGGDTYRCVRELRRGTRGGKTIEKTSARMWRGDTELEGITPSAMTNEVATILGMGPRAFRGANYIAQGEVDALTTAPPSEVASLIEEHTGVTALTKLRDHARKDASTAQARADGLIGDPDVVAAAEATEGEAQKALRSADQEHEAARAQADRA
ncbi:MAG: SMC family ATPase, partial [Tomitella sp.]|nr:SMC family ATPase [Tomitella sp.]